MEFLLSLAVALAVRLDSPGPAVFSQWRVGLHGRAFRIHKFRSMRHEPVDTPRFAGEDDPRITRLEVFPPQVLVKPGDAQLGYSVPNLLVEYSMRNTHVPVGAWRGVNTNQNGLYMECFIEEVARAAGLK